MKKYFLKISKDKAVRYSFYFILTIALFLTPNLYADEASEAKTCLNNMKIIHVACERYILDNDAATINYPSDLAGKYIEEELKCPLDNSSYKITFKDGLVTISCSSGYHGSFNGDIVNPPSQSLLQRVAILKSYKVLYIQSEKNLKTINLALRAYANDFDGQFPPDNGAKGLDLLREHGYIKDPVVFVSPFTETVPAAPGEALTEDTVDYYYQGGLNEYSPSETAILWSKPHHGIALSIDGTIKGKNG